MPVMNTHDLISKLTPDRVAAAVGAELKTVWHHRSQGVFPASWFVPMRDLGAQDGILVPEKLFNWKNRQGDAA